MNPRLQIELYPPERAYRGAPMGRDTSPPGWCKPARMRVHAMPIDAQGYDPGGAYWGGPSPSAGVMFTAWGRDLDRMAIDHTRAPSKAIAIARFRARWPGVVIT